MESSDSNKKFIDLFNGSFFNGDIVDGKKHGKGIFVITEKFYYVGEFRNDKFHGQGYLIYVVGETRYFEYRGRYDYHVPLQRLCKYEGDFKKGLKDGIGKERILDGTIYEGGFLKDKRHGKGKLYISDEIIVEGDWRNGKPWNLKEKRRNGLERIKLVSGQGKGKFHLSNRQKYKGQFENGVFSGYGILEMDEGVTFVGNWDGDNFQGTLKTEEFRIEGEWKHRQPWNVHGYDVDDELFMILSEGGKKDHN